MKYLPQNPEIFTQNRKRFVEKIKRFGEDYRSSYMIFSDANATPLGVLNVPYFDDDSLNYGELKAFLIRLSYAYIIMILVAIAFAYFVSKYITKSLQTIRDKMKGTRLEKRNQNIRDDILEMNDLKPSHTRMHQGEWEASIKRNEEAGATAYTSKK